MANLQKYNKSALGHILAHYERTSNASNPNIQANKTSLNYNLAPAHDMSDYEYLQERVSQVKCQKRKDVNLACTWCVTAPKDLPEHELPDFFKHTYEFLEKKYGRANVVSAWVHMDETTPHLHYCFVPVVQSINKRTQQPIEKVSAKECITRGDLILFHGELQAHLEQALGHPVAILNGATKEGNRAIQELKRESAVDRLKSAQNEVNRMIKSTYEQLAPLRAEYAAKMDYLESAKASLNQMRPEVKKKGIFNKQEYVEVPLNEWMQMRHVLAQPAAIDRAQLRLNNDLKRIEQTEFGMQIQYLQKRTEELQMQLQSTELKLLQAENTIKKYEYYNKQFFAKFPEQQRNQLLNMWNRPNDSRTR